MVRFDSMLMIGSSGSNVGKTELACRLLQRFGRTREIVGVKVTTVTSTDQPCPRGGRGCGVCSAMEGAYRITEETDCDSGKDTGRLLAAGAAKVYWLRVMRGHLHQGWIALAEIVGHDAVVICESNSLRQVVQPGLFLIVESSDPEPWKASARQVRRDADGIVASNGDGFDLDLERIQLAGTRWVLREDATAIVMAGGRSHRMGTDKSMLPIKGRPMVEHICRQLEGTFAQVLISANDAEKYAFLDLDVVPDRMPGHGPLMGIASALEASDSEFNLVVACDIPQIDLPFARRMLAAAKGADAVIPVTGDGEKQPLFAIYRKSVQPGINEVLAFGGRRISHLYGLCQVHFMELDDTGWFANLNTMADYQGFRSRDDA
jgi:molybdenum cofactor guanylyltransferase